MTDQTIFGMVPGKHKLYLAYANSILGYALKTSELNMSPLVR